MFDAIEFMLDDGTTVAIASAPRSGSSQVGLGDRLQAAEKTLRESLAPVMAAAAQTMDTFRGMPRRPEDVEIAFGVTFDGRLGGVIASANTGAQLQVKLRWRGSAEPAAAD